MTREDVMKDPYGLGRKKTTKEFIESELKDMVSLIEMIEEKSKRVLVGERSFLDKPYTDCKNMSNLQVVMFFAQWRTGILARYNGVDLS